MKKNKINIFKLLILSIAFLVGGCNNKLIESPLTSLTKDNFFKTPDDFNLALNGIYSSLLQDKTWGAAAYVTLTFDDDDTQAGNSYRPGQDGNYDMVTRTADQWKGFYSVAQNCNVFLAALKKQNFLPSATARVMRAQAQFIRALVYFELTRRFGDVPLRLDPYIEGQTSQNIPRTPVDSVYRTMAREFQQAADSLPETYIGNPYNSVNDRGKPTKPAALGLLMKTYMHLAGAEVYGPGGSLANADLALTYYKKAAATGRLITQLATKNSFPIIEKEYMKPFDPATQNTCNEILFSVQTLTNVGKGIELAFTLCPPASGFSGTDGTGGGGQVTLRADFIGTKFQKIDKRIEGGKALVDSFFNAKSSEMRWYYVYDPTKPIVANVKNGSLPLGSTKASGTVPELPNVGIYSGANALNYGWDKTIDINLPGGRGKVKATPKIYSLKYTDPKALGKLDNGSDIIVLRYSDILLLLAEAENEAYGGPTATADSAINAVRTRAGINTFTGKGVLSQSVYRDSVRLERRRELYFEFQRRWDLIRWGKFVSVMNGAGRPRQEFQKIYPLPIEELSGNNYITTNNPGY